MLRSFLLGTDTIDNFLGVLLNSRVVGAFNHMDPMFEEGPRMGSATAVALDEPPDLLEPLLSL